MANCPAVITCTDVMADEHPELVVAYMKAMIKVGRWANADKHAAAGILNRQTFYRDVEDTYQGIKDVDLVPNLSPQNMGVRADRGGGLVEVLVSVSPLAPVKVNERSFDPGVTLNGCLVTPRCVQVAWVQSPTKLFVLASKVAAPVPLHWNGCLVRVWVVDVVWLSALVDEDWLRDCVDEQHADAKRAVRFDLRDCPHFPSVIGRASCTFDDGLHRAPDFEGVGTSPLEL